jgi:hypothetical protein
MLVAQTIQKARVRNLPAPRCPTSFRKYQICTGTPLFYSTTTPKVPQTEASKKGRATKKNTTRIEYDVITTLTAYYEKQVSNLLEEVREQVQTYILTDAKGRFLPSFLTWLEHNPEKTSKYQEGINNPKELCEKLLPIYLIDVEKQMRNELELSLLQPIKQKGNQSMNEMINEDALSLARRRRDDSKQVIANFLKELLILRGASSKKLATRLISVSKIDPTTYLMWVRQILTQRMSKRTSINLEKKTFWMQEPQNRKGRRKLQQGKSKTTAYTPTNCHPKRKQRVFPFIPGKYPLK